MKLENINTFSNKFLTCVITTKHQSEIFLIKSFMQSLIIKNKDQEQGSKEEK